MIVQWTVRAMSLLGAPGKVFQLRSLSQHLSQTMMIIIFRTSMSARLGRSARVKISSASTPRAPSSAWNVIRSLHSLNKSHVFNIDECRLAMAANQTGRTIALSVRRVSRRGRMMCVWRTRMPVGFSPLTTQGTSRMPASSLPPASFSTKTGLWRASSVALWRSTSAARSSTWQTTRWTATSSQPLAPWMPFNSSLPKGCLAWVTWGIFPLQRIWCEALA